jgi:hypothetical protein
MHFYVVGSFFNTIYILCKASSDVPPHVSINLKALNTDLSGPKSFIVDVMFIFACH